MVNSVEIITSDHFEQNGLFATAAALGSVTGQVMYLEKDRRKKQKCTKVEE